MTFSISGLPGLFVVFEGGEGAGKTSLIRSLETSLLAQKFTVVRTREPGGSPSAEQIRNILVSGNIDRLDALSETLLFTAARREHLRETILPALSQGAIVLCDRYLGSTLAYQGPRGVSEAEILDLHHRFCGGILPHLTFILDIPPEIGLARAGHRLTTESSHEFRFETMSLEIHRHIRHLFLEQAARDPTGHIILDATQEPSIVHNAALSALLAKISTQPLLPQAPTPSSLHSALSPSSF